MPREPSESALVSLFSPGYLHYLYLVSRGMSCLSEVHQGHFEIYLSWRVTNWSNLLFIPQVVAHHGFSHGLWTLLFILFSVYLHYAFCQDMSFQLQAFTHILSHLPLLLLHGLSTHREINRATLTFSHPPGCLAVTRQSGGLQVPCGSLLTSLLDPKTTSPPPSVYWSSYHTYRSAAILAHRDDLRLL